MFNIFIDTNSYATAVFHSVASIRCIIVQIKFMIWFQQSFAQENHIYMMFFDEVLEFGSGRQCSDALGIPLHYFERFFIWMHTRAVSLLPQFGRFLFCTEPIVPLHR